MRLTMIVDNDDEIHRQTLRIRKEKKRNIALSYRFQSRLQRMISMDFRTVNKETMHICHLIIRHY